MRAECGEKGYGKIKRKGGRCKSSVRELYIFITKK
jgi:hypothetical protein